MSIESLIALGMITVFVNVMTKGRSNYKMFAGRITSGAKYWSIPCPNIDN